MRRRWLVALHVAQAAFLFWIAWRGDFCCDAYYYLHTGQRLLREGIAYHDDFAGYRSYLVPLVFGLLDLIPAPSMRGSGQSIPFTLGAAFVAASVAASLHVLRRESAGRYLTFAIPVLFNPFLLAHVPAPLQESVVMIACVPLLFVLLAVRERSPYATVGLAALVVSLAFTIRGSMAWLALPLAIFVALEARRAPARWREASKAKLAALAAGVFVALIAPQSLIMAQKLGTLDPYPRRWIVDQQAMFGVEMFKYATLKHEGKWKGLRFHTPYDSLPLEKKTFAFYRENTGPAVLLVVTHVWAGLHYDVLTTYVKMSDLKILNVWIVLSSLVVAWGILGLLRYCRDPAERSRGMLLASMLVLSCGYTAFAGVEARFGMLGFLALSLGAAQLFSSPGGRTVVRSSLPLALAYAVLCLAFNGLLLYTTPEI